MPLFSSCSCRVKKVRDSDAHFSRCGYHQSTARSLEAFSESTPCHHHIQPLASSLFQNFSQMPVAKCETWPSKLSEMVPRSSSWREAYGTDRHPSVGTPSTACALSSGRFEIENDETRTMYLPGSRYSEAARSPKATGWFRSTICSKQAAPRQLVTPARKAKGRRGGKHAYRTHPNHTALTRNTSFLSRQLAEQASFGFSATRTVCIKPLHVRKTTSITAHYFTRDSKPKLYVATSQASFFRRLLILR